MPGAEHEANMVSIGEERNKFKRLQYDLADWTATLSAILVLRVYAATRKIGQHVQYARKRLADFGYLVKTGQSRVQEMLRKKETELATMLSESSEPIIVTDDEHRIWAANSAALGLLGVSRTNFNKFAIDAFLAPGQLRCFERHGSRFIRSAERLGECEIRPFGGTPKIVQFSFQGNFVLGRHVSKFRDIA